MWVQSEIRKNSALYSKGQQERGLCNVPLSDSRPRSTYLIISTYLIMSTSSFLSICSLLEQEAAAKQTAVAIIALLMALVFTFVITLLIVGNLNISFISQFLKVKRENYVS